MLSSPVSCSLLTTGLASIAIPRMRVTTFLSSAALLAVMRVDVRVMKAPDAAAVAALWKNGLPQTADAAPWWMRPFVASAMTKYGQKALQEDGDVGPEGRHLMKNWNDKSENLRRMFVAVLLDEDEDNNDENHPIVGVIGVRKGFEEDEEDPENNLASIWRMSVDASVRRQGVGLALMSKAEDWARSNGCTSMKLVTGNAIAARFYTEKAGYQVMPPEKDPTLTWWERLQPWRVVNFIHYYEKKL